MYTLNSFLASVDFWSTTKSCDATTAPHYKKWKKEVGGLPYETADTPELRTAVVYKSVTSCSDGRYSGNWGNRFTTWNLWRFISFDCLILNNDTLHSSETSATICQSPLRNIPEDWNLQRPLWEKISHKKQVPLFEISVRFFSVPKLKVATIISLAILHNSQASYYESRIVLAEVYRLTSETESPSYLPLYPNTISAKILYVRLTSLVRSSCPVRNKPFDLTTITKISYSFRNSLQTLANPLSLPNIFLCTTSLPPVIWPSSCPTLEQRSNFRYFTSLYVGLLWWKSL